VYSLFHAYHRAISWWFHKCLPFCPIGARVSLILSKYSTWCWSTFDPCRYDPTHEFVHPPRLIYPWECHLRWCQSSFRYRSLTPMEAVSINVELKKVLLHPEHPMKLSDKEDWLMNATWLESTTCSITHAWKEKLHGRQIRFLHSSCLDIISSPWSMHLSSFLVLPSFHKSWNDISFMGRGL
jgi:hypothetical protein